MRKLAKVMVAASLISCASKPPPKAAPKITTIEIPKAEDGNAPLPKPCIDYPAYVQKAEEMCDRPTIKCMLSVRRMLLDDLKKRENPLFSVSISKGKPARFIGPDNEVIELFLSVYENGEYSITEEDPEATAIDPRFRRPFFDALEATRRMLDIEPYVVLNDFLDNMNILFVKIEKTKGKSVKLYYHEDVFCQNRKERDRILNEKFAREHGDDEYDVGESEFEEYE